MKFTGLKDDMILYRGLSGGKLPDKMFQPDKNGRLGAGHVAYVCLRANLASLTTQKGVLIQ